MQLNLGNKIRELRRRDGRTQEALAEALGVTSQAVSRWESGGSYPDMEVIPSIANYFGVSIDELFGYHSTRESKIDAIIQKVEEYNLRYRADGEWFDECISILRESLAEFPKNERLLLALADVLSEAGWRRDGERLYYDDEGYIQHDHEKHRKNNAWAESVKICEYLVDNAESNSTVTKAISILVLLYRNFGEYDKAISYAERMPELQKCREYLLTDATDGKQEAEYIGEFLLKSAKEFSEQLVFGLIVNLNNFNTDMPIWKVKGAIGMFDLICDDGNFGAYHNFVSKLYLYLSRLQWERGYHEDAFTSLDDALKHEKAYERLMDGEEHKLTAPLVSFVKYRVDVPEGSVKELPFDWPFWCYPDFDQVEKEIKSDPRWEEWVAKTQA